MLRDRVKTYYIDQDFNCAETILRAANDEYALGLDEGAFRLVGGFGGGMGCGHTCGALCGGISAIGERFITTRAHQSPDLKDICTRYVQAFNEALGSENCDELKGRYKRDPVRCLDVVEHAADILEQVLAEAGKPVRPESLSEYTEKLTQ